ncbi:MAG: DUF5680 domain-containing protein [archaeon]
MTELEIGGIVLVEEEFRNFLVENKRLGFAGGGEYKRVEKGLLKGYERFTNQEGDLHYEDNFFGSRVFGGFELVRHGGEEGTPLWVMSYCGHMDIIIYNQADVKAIADAFLNDSLSRVSPERPFRGPESELTRGLDVGHHWVDGEGYYWDYNAITRGNLLVFAGHDVSRTNRFPDCTKESLPQPAMRCEYHGGILIG